MTDPIGTGRRTFGTRKQAGFDEAGTRGARQHAGVIAASLIASQTFPFRRIVQLGQGRHHPCAQSNTAMAFAVQVLSLRISACSIRLRSSFEVCLPDAALNLIAACGSKAVSMAVHASSADGPSSGSSRVCVDLNPCPADCPSLIPIAVFIRPNRPVADRAARSAIAIAIGANVLAADPTTRVPVSISVGVDDATAVDSARISRAIRVKKSALGTQWKNRNCQH
jgi:hypothetical protein